MSSEEWLKVEGEISKLTDEELGSKRIELGLNNSTPVTSSTRRILEKHLIVKILQLKGTWQEPQEVINNPINGFSKPQNSSNEKSNSDRNSKISNHSSCFHFQQQMFYAVSFPSDAIGPGTECPRVLEDKEQALKIVKANKRARFKACKTLQEAENFAAHQSDIALATTPQLLTSNSSNHIPSIIDGASKFKGPKSQDLVLLRKAIEKGDLSDVSFLVWDNPRYLVSSGDTPSILQEGARYNAVHIASKAQNAEMTQYLLNTVSDTRFIKRLYNIEAEENSKQRAMFLLDLYLNTPDKSANETPLHMAVKLGAVRVVEVLVSFPECDKSRLNKHNQRPDETICSRVTNASQAVVDEIRDLLKERYFVPVLRSLNGEIEPTIGEPFSSKNPLVTNDDPFYPRMNVTAYAGPMDQEKALMFRRKWKTPPRTSRHAMLRLKDFDRGMERMGRNLAVEFSVKWKEYWHFLGVFADFSTNEDLLKLDEHLGYKFKSVSKQQLTPDLSPLEKTPEDKQGGTPNAVLSPMSELCVALGSISLQDRESPCTPPKVEAAKKNRMQPENSTANPQEDAPAIQSPLLYIEKTCHVFARRISDSIIHVLQANQDESHKRLSKILREIIHPEIKHVHKLVVSFKSNSNFTNVKFHMIHSRIASLVPFYLAVSAQDQDLMQICSGLEQLTPARPNDLSSDDEEEAVVNNHRPQQPPPPRLKDHVACLSHQLITTINAYSGGSSSIETDVPVEETWEHGVECSCSWSPTPLTRAMRRGASLRRGMARQGSSRVWTRDEAVQVVQSLPEPKPNQEEDLSEASDSEESNTCQKEEDDMDADSYHTPPTSISSVSSRCTTPEKDDDVFTIPDQGVMVFLEGSLPTKLDVDVLRALEKAELSSENYPNIWRWRHQVLQFSEGERERWPSPALMWRRGSCPSPNSSLTPSLPSLSSSPLTHRTRQTMQQVWGSPDPPFSSPKRRLNL